MSDSTLSRRASLFTEDRAEDPGKKEVNNHISSLFFSEESKHEFPEAPGVLRLVMKAFFGVVCSSSKSNSVGVRGLGKHFYTGRFQCLYDKVKNLKQW